MLFVTTAVDRMVELLPSSSCRHPTRTTTTRAPIVSIYIAVARPHLVSWTAAPTQLLHPACIEPPRPTPSPSRTGTTATPGPTPLTRRCCAALRRCWTRRTFSLVVGAGAQLGRGGASTSRRWGKRRAVCRRIRLRKRREAGPRCKLSYLSDCGMFSKFMRGQSAKVPRRTDVPTVASPDYL
jgi:hypothetical protein